MEINPLQRVVPTYSHRWKDYLHALLWLSHHSKVVAETPVSFLVFILGKQTLFSERLLFLPSCFNPLRYSQNFRRPTNVRDWIKCSIFSFSCFSHMSWETQTSQQMTFAGSRNQIDIGFLIFSLSHPLLGERERESKRCSRERENMRIWESML